MPLTIVRQEAASRLHETQAYLSLVKNVEVPGVPSTMELNIQKGLFIVILYGSLEYSLTRAMTEVSLLINSHNVAFNHISELLYPLVLDAQLSSIKDTSRALKWLKRADLFEKQTSNDTVTIKEGAFLDEMQNVKSAVITQLFKVLGIIDPPLYDVRARQYIDEVVDKRNAVAHGRESPAAVGQAYNTARLQILLDVLSKQIQYIFSAFEGHLQSKAFVKAVHQSLY